MRGSQVALTNIHTQQWNIRKAWEEVTPPVRKISLRNLITNSSMLKSHSGEWNETLSFPES